MDDRNKQIEILENFVRKINLEKRQQSQVKFTYKRCFMETFIIGKHIREGFKKKVGSFP